MTSQLARAASRLPHPKIKRRHARMRRAKGGHELEGGSGRPSYTVEDEVIMTLSQAREMEDRGLFSEAVHLYTEGIDLLLRLARGEPYGPRKQKLQREAELYVTKAENIKAMLEPIHPAGTPAPSLRRASSLGSAQRREGGATSGTRGGRGRGRGRVGRSRTGADASDIWGSARGGSGKISEGVGRPTVSSSMRGGGRGEPRASKQGGGGGEAKGSTPGSGAGQSRGGASASVGNPELEKKVLEEMLDSSPGITWDMVVGQGEAKQTLQETVILPILRPDLFTGLRAPSRGVLLYGPPGTGKTMLAKAVATESAYSFFSISASSLTSKWVGEGEKLVRALFSAARKHQPAVIFVDEIDSVLSARAEGEQEASRRLKTEFLVQFDGMGHGGASDGEGEHLLLLAATNLPQELDEAVLRRLSRRVYVPLPDPPARRALLTKLLASGGASNLSAHEMSSLVVDTEGYSGSDLKVLCHVAALQPIRELGSRVRTVDARDVRDINLGDFKKALLQVRPSVSKKTVEKYHEWEMSMQR